MDTRKTAAITAAAMAAAGIVTNAAYDAPLDLAEPVPLEETVDSGTTEESGGQPEERQRGSLARFRRWADRLPEEVRALVGVPLWWLGAALTEGAVLLWTAAASPAAACLVRWLLLLAVAVLVFAASVKAALPDVPLGRLLKPRSLAPPADRRTPLWTGGPGAVQPGHFAPRLAMAYRRVLRFRGHLCLDGTA